MKLTDDERAMRDGKEGPAAQKAMDLLIRYGEALNAERLVDTRNVAGVVGSSSIFIRDHYDKTGTADRDVVFSRFDLDSDEVVKIPQAKVFTCHLQTGMDMDNWEIQGVKPEVHDFHEKSQEFSASLGVQLLNTCTPYVAGNVPVKGEHCAWMESSAVVYCNSVIGARTNTEGRESTSAAMLTGKIPYWGYHMDENRLGAHRIDVEVDVESVMDWGMLGYFVGGVVQEEVPVVNGITTTPNLIRHKHFGAASASSGGVELYHIVGVTPEAPSVEVAFGTKKPVTTVRYGKAERQRVFDDLNAHASDTNVDYIMLGCPHYSIEQIWEACRLLEGKRISENSRMWIFTSRSVKDVADKNGYTKIIRDAGALLMTDTCSALGQLLPKDAKVAATDSAKQTHYLPAILGIEAWFGSTADCINTAMTGRWNPEPL